MGLKKGISIRKIRGFYGRGNKAKGFVVSFNCAVAMLIYITWRFELRFAIAAIVALVHDVLITFSIYSIFSIPANDAFIAAILTIIGYSINDTIVIFDRIREETKLILGNRLKIL